MINFIFARIINDKCFDVAECIKKVSFNYYFFGHEAVFRFKQNKI
jgi:hypothetical protein